MIVLKVDMLVKAGTEEKCKELIRIMQEHSRKEAGCLLYTGHQSVEDPRRFFFYAQYADQAALEFHRDAPCFKQYVPGHLDTLKHQRIRDLGAPVDEGVRAPSA